MLPRGQTLKRSPQAHGGDKGGCAGRRPGHRRRAPPQRAADEQQQRRRDRPHPRPPRPGGRDGNAPPRRPVLRASPAAHLRLPSPACRPPLRDLAAGASAVTARLRSRRAGGHGATRADARSRVPTTSHCMPSIGLDRPPQEVSPQRNGFSPRAATAAAPDFDGRRPAPERRPDGPSHPHQHHRHFGSPRFRGSPAGRGGPHTRISTGRAGSPVARATISAYNCTWRR